MEDYILGGRSSRIEGTLLTKLLNSDLDGVWNSFDSRFFGESWVLSLQTKYGFSDSIVDTFFQNFDKAIKTYDAELARKSIRLILNQGISYEAHLDACKSAASEPTLVPGAIKFRNEMLRAGYTFCLNSLSPVELVRAVGRDRLGIPTENCFGTQMFDESGKQLAEPMINIAPIKRTYTENLKEKLGMNVNTMEIGLTDDKSDARMMSRILTNPLISVKDEISEIENTSFHFPEARYDIFPLAKKIQQYEIALMTVSLGIDAESLCRKAHDIRELVEKSANAEETISEIESYLEKKKSVYNSSSLDRIRQSINATRFSKSVEKRKELKSIMNELKTYSFEFCVGEEALKNLL